MVNVMSSYFKDVFNLLVWDRSGVVSKSVPLLMCIAPLQVALEMVQNRHAFYLISAQQNLPTYQYKQVSDFAFSFNWDRSF